MSKFVITQDIQEKQPLIFQDVEVEIEHLKTGDYSIKGYHDRFTVEHKTIKDLIGTCDHNKVKGKKDSNYARFKRELARMRATFDFYAIVISGYPKEMLPECYRIAAMQSEAGYKKIVAPIARFNGVIGSLKGLRVDYNCHFYFEGTKEWAAEWIVDQATYFLRHIKTIKIKN